jgi:hypothetical protein
LVYLRPEARLGYKDRWDGQKLLATYRRSQQASMLPKAKEVDRLEGATLSNSPEDSLAKIQRLVVPAINEMPSRRKPLDEIMSYLETQVFRCS